MKNSLSKILKLNIGIVKNKIFLVNIMFVIFLLGLKVRKIPFGNPLVTLQGKDKNFSALIFVLPDNLRKCVK